MKIADIKRLFGSIGILPTNKPALDNFKSEAVYRLGYFFVHASLSEKQLKQFCIPTIINYAENLRRAIAEDDLVIMRRYENPERFLESFESAALRIRNPECTRRINDNLTICDPEDDDSEEECSETEQDEDEEISESGNKPDEDFQLKLF